MNARGAPVDMEGQAGTDPFVRFQQVVSAHQAEWLARAERIVRDRDEAEDQGVFDDFAEKFLSKWSQRALPQLSRGFALPDEAPFLSGDCSGVHPVGEMVDRASGDRIAFSNRPFHCRNTAVSR